MYVYTFIYRYFNMYPNLYMYFFFFLMFNISFIYIKISTFYLQDSNFLLVFLPSLAHPTQHLFNTSVVMCTCCGTHLFDSCTIFSRGFHSMKKHPPLFTKVPLYNFQRFNVSFFTNIILRNTTFFTKIMLCCLCTH